MTLDFLTFADAPADVPAALPPWKVAVIDDDEAVHEGTRFALSGFALKGRPVELLSAHSAEEGLGLVARHPDLAVILLDVVMEREDAGLRLVESIRNDLGNAIVRIILRTGQPGQAPERRVVVDYDINDYKAKTELTADRLFTAMTAALRSFEQLKQLDETRAGLELIIAAAGDLFEERSLERLAEGVLRQMNALAGMEVAGLLVVRGDGSAPPRLLARIGTMSSLPESDPESDLSALFRRSGPSGRPTVADGWTRLHVRTGAGLEVLVLLEGEIDLDDTRRALLALFGSKIGIAFDNARLHADLVSANADLERRVAARTAELTAANERLEERGAQLKRANAFKNEVLSTVVHDIKNPLAVILGRSEMIADIAANGPEGTSGGAGLDLILGQVGHIRSAAQRLTRMVDISIADAMADALDIGIRRRAIQLGPIARDVAETCRSLAEAKEQRLAIVGSDALPVQGDPDRLAEALDNLVSNAIKYAPVGGEIEVRMEARDGEARVRVADSGPGLAPGDAERLFHRFQRLTARPTGGESSTGLGLSIVRRIVDLHGGRVEVDGQGPLGGAAFALVLPLRRS